MMRKKCYSICISKDNDFLYPKSLSLKFKNFTGKTILDKTEEKLCFLYTCCHETKQYYNLHLIKEIVSKIGVNVEIENNFDYETHKLNIDKMPPSTNIFLVEILNNIIENPEYLLSLLFNPFSFILIGDNIIETFIDIEYEHIAYYIQ